MLRFATFRDLCAVFMRRTSPSSRLAKGQMNRISLAQSGISVQEVNFFTKSPYRKDNPLPEPPAPDGPPDTVDLIDLDKWKAVMKLKAVPEEKVQVEMNDEDENDEETTNKLTLEATRELVTMWRFAGKTVPQEISDDELQSLAKLTTKAARKKYLKYLALREHHKHVRKEKQLKKKAAIKAIREQKAQEEGDDQKEFKSSLIKWYWSRSLDTLLAWRCAHAMIFGQPLVFDMSYEGNMSKREVENTVSQLMEAEAWNRRATEPYHLHVCNLQPDSYHKQHLIKRYGAETWDRLLITSTDKQHFEVFPREQLVYLTPDSPNVLRTYDHNKVYIIGGFVDRKNQPGVSLANAKRFNLATARLPLDNFLHWDLGSKSLTLDQMIRIMLNVKETENWHEALQFVPTRKHDGFYSHLQNETKERPVMKKRGNFFSEGASLKDFNGNNADIANIRSFNRPMAVKTKTKKTINRDWWNQK